MRSNPLCAPLKNALCVVCAKSKVLPVNERMKACKGFMEKDKKRVTRPEAVISKGRAEVDF